MLISLGSKNEHYNEVALYLFTDPGGMKAELAWLVDL